MCLFHFYAEFDSNFKLLQKQVFNIPDHLMIHDWAFTDTHYILFANRIKLDVVGNYEIYYVSHNSNYKCTFINKL